jgi:hypothetical protein
MVPCPFRKRPYHCSAQRLKALLKKLLGQGHLPDGLCILGDVHAWYVVRFLEKNRQPSPPSKKLPNEPFRLPGDSS